MIHISHSVTPEQCAALQLVLNDDKSSSITQLVSNLTGFRQEYLIGAFCGDRLVGLAVLVGAGELELEIYKLYVDPTFRGQNIAVNLVNEVLRSMCADGFKVLNIEISSSGSDFWKKYKHGYDYSCDGSRIAIWLLERPLWLDEYPEIFKSWT